MLETLPFYSALGLKPRMTDETPTAAVGVQSQSKATTTLYDEDPEGSAMRTEAATDSETPSTVEDAQPSSTTSEESSLTSPYPEVSEEESPTENELQSTRETLSSLASHPKPEEESPTENVLFSTNQSATESGDDLMEAKPDDNARRVEEEVSLLYSAEGLGRD